jgi:hypothetical protein
MPEQERESLDTHPFTKETRECLDELYEYQVEDAPPWFFASEQLNALTPSPVAEGYDEDED